MDEIAKFLYENAHLDSTGCALMEESVESGVFQNLDRLHGECIRMFAYPNKFLTVTKGFRFYFKQHIFAGEINSMISLSHSFGFKSEVVFEGGSKMIVPNDRPHCNVFLEEVFALRYDNITLPVGALLIAWLISGILFFFEILYPVFKVKMKRIYKHIIGITLWVLSMLGFRTRDTTTQTMAPTRILVLPR